MAKKYILALVIIADIFILAVALKEFNFKINIAKSKIPFRLGDRVPEWRDGISLTGQAVEVIRGARSFTVLLFFNEALREEIRDLDEFWQSQKINTHLRFVGVLKGDKRAGDLLIEKYNIRFPIVTDSQGLVGKSFHYSSLPNRGATIIIDGDLKVLVNIPEIVKPDLLKDFLSRHLSNAISMAVDR